MNDDWANYACRCRASRPRGLKAMSEQEKTLGQVLIDECARFAKAKGYEAYEWLEAGNFAKQQAESAAQAVAARVREECAQQLDERAADLMRRYEEACEKQPNDILVQCGLSCSASEVKKGSDAIRAMNEASQ